jgi:hypothetical protein
VMMQQKTAVLVDDEAARSEVSELKGIAGERLSLNREELDHRPAMLRLGGIGRLVRAKLLQELLVSCHADGNQ